MLKLRVLNFAGLAPQFLHWRLLGQFSRAASGAGPLRHPRGERLAGPVMRGQPLGVDDRSAAALQASAGLGTAAAETPVPGRRPGLRARGRSGEPVSGGPAGARARLQWRARALGSLVCA